MNILGRIGFAGVGLLGSALFFPNFMMSDSGTPRAIIAANIGCAASYLLIASGIAGVLHHPTIFPIFYAINFGVIGIGLQGAAALTFVMIKKTNNK